MNNRPSQHFDFTSEQQNNQKNVSSFLVPVIMSGVLAIYGLIVGVILSQKGTFRILLSNMLKLFCK